MIKKCVLLKEKKEKKKKTKQRIVGGILIVVGIFGGFFSVQDWLQTRTQEDFIIGIIFGIILLTGISLTGMGSSSMWVSSD